MNKLKIVGNKTSSSPTVDPLAFPVTKPFNVTQSTSTSNKYDVYLSEPIGEVHEYFELYTLLSGATQNDVVYMHINCPGGSVDTGLQIIAHMKDSHAHIVTALYGTTASMGTAIFLSGDEFMVSKHSRLMIHNFSGVVGGKGHEMLSQMASVAKYVADAFKDIHVPFVTEDEFTRIIKGEDMWLHDEEVIERLERMVDHKTRVNIEQQIASHIESIDILSDTIEQLQEQLDELNSPKEDADTPQ